MTKKDNPSVIKLKVAQEPIYEWNGRYKTKTDTFEVSVSELEFLDLEITPDMAPKKIEELANKVFTEEWNKPLQNAERRAHDHRDWRAYGTYVDSESVESKFEQAIDKHRTGALILKKETIDDIIEREAVASFLIEVLGEETGELFYKVHIEDDSIREIAKERVAREQGLDVAEKEKAMKREENRITQALKRARKKLENNTALLSDFGLCQR